MSLMSMNPTECLTEELFEVNQIQSVTSLLIFLDCTFVTYTLSFYKTMHSKLKFGGSSKKIRVLFHFFPPFSYVIIQRRINESELGNTRGMI